MGSRRCFSASVSMSRRVSHGDGEVACNAGEWKERDAGPPQMIRRGTLRDGDVVA